MGIGKDSDHKSGGITCSDTSGGEEKRKLLLYRLSRLVKELYPTTRTKNPYSEGTDIILEYLNPEEQLLFKDLVHALTVLNGSSAMTGTHELVSTQIDHVNALQMLLPKELQLTARVIESHEKLASIYQDRPFTYLEACVKLRISHTGLIRLLKPLLLHGLIIKYKPEKGTRNLLQLVETGKEDNPSDMFEQMQGDWKDYTGFVEL